LAQKPERKRPPLRPRHKWEDDIKIHLKQMQWEGMDWFGMAEDRDKWQAVSNVVMNIQIPYTAGDFLTK